MQKLVAIALAGAAGTLARYALGGFIQRTLGSAFPWGTIAINLLGCFAFGAVWAAAQERGLLSADTRTIVLVGFMGAFTTFSTFVAESGQMLAEREILLGMGNIALQVVVGLMVFFMGLMLGRAI